MKKFFLRTPFAALVLLCTAAMTMAQPALKLEPVIEGLTAPWAVAPLPQGGALVTQRGGTLVYAQGGTLNPVAGVPTVATQGQGGLLDVTLARDFATSRTLFLSYATPQQSGAGTALSSARLSPDNATLEDVTQLFEMKPGSSGGRHFGSRVVEAPDGTLFLTIGDRGDRNAAQDRSRHNGSVVRLNRDGSVPADNPFTDQPQMLPEIWSYGHRNPQGAALDLKGNLWVSEHGAKGGDEVNMIRRGANFGWPVISYGRHYSGERIGEGTEKPGMMQPEFYWDPSIAPSGLLIYSGRMFPEWKGHVFVGSLKFDHIAHLAGSPLRALPEIATAATARVRDIVEAPDGAIWFISEPQGTVYRISRK